METHSQLEQLLSGLDKFDQAILLSHVDTVVLQMTRAAREETAKEDREELEERAFKGFLSVYSLYEKKVGQVEAGRRIIELCSLLGLKPGLRISMMEKYEPAGKFSPLRDILRLSEEIQRKLRPHLK